MGQICDLPVDCVILVVLLTRSKRQYRETSGLLMYLVRQSNFVENSELCPDGKLLVRISGFPVGRRILSNFLRGSAWWR
jgi:hypothetical protein